MAETYFLPTPVRRITDAAVPHLHWALRLVMASVFLYHGTSKFEDPAGFATMMGLPSSLGIWVALAEVGAGTMLVAGGFPHRLCDLATRVGGLLAATVMVGAISIAHWPRWNFVPSEGFPMGGMEFQVVLAVLGLYFLVRGHDPDASQ